MNNLKMFAHGESTEEYRESKSNPEPAGKSIRHGIKIASHSGCTVRCTKPIGGVGTDWRDFNGKFGFWDVMVNLSTFFQESGFESSTFRSSLGSSNR